MKPPPPSPPQIDAMKDQLKMQEKFQIFSH